MVYCRIGNSYIYPITPTSYTAPTSYTPHPAPFLIPLRRLPLPMQTQVIRPPNVSPKAIPQLVY